MNSKLKALINTPVSLVKGLTVTMANLVRTKTTVKYPEVMPEPAGRAGQTDPEDAFERPYELGPRFRGLHGLTKDPATGDLNCIGCMACAKVCPDDLISMDLEKREGHSGRYPVTFTVNIGPCCFCGLCAEVCPTPMRAIVMTDLFEWATYRRDGQNLVLTKDDLVRHGDLEVARRAGGRSWENGELTGVLPEEEGNPYFQFAPEYEAERKKGDKPAEGTAREKPEKPAGGQAKPERTTAAATPPAAPAAPLDPAATVREAFAAAGQPFPSDLAGFDLATLDSIEDRKVRAQLKSAVMKARKAMEGDSPAPSAPAAAPTPAPAPASDPLAAAREAFAAAGRPFPDDLQAFDLNSLDEVEDRRVRAQLKSAVAKARKAVAGEATPPEPVAEAAAAAPAEVTPPPVSVPETAGPPPVDETTALREALRAVLRQAGMDTPEQPETLSLESLDAIEDRKLRGQAKSALRKLHKALGLVE